MVILLETSPSSSTTPCESSFSAADLPPSGVDASSWTSSSTFLPLMPPAALISATAIFAPSWLSSPQGLFSPLKLATRPTFTVSPSIFTGAPVGVGDFHRSSWRWCRSSRPALWCPWSPYRYRPAWSRRNRR